ncbi:hypothetical protein ABW19_dt0206141 [Dactylella cylindrospora]|nr:hypothetical protein ABW19_dt0206141 [Dactylella cylindrospora]
MEAISEKHNGSLVIVGSGIRSIGQFTLEAITHIEDADVVYYVVSDPVCEGYIKGKNSNAIDLYQFYSNTKPRTDTYVQMAEVMLQSVRQGQNVVGVFYGHPGVFVNPSFRAIGIARNEGYKAYMLPGISAEDCLFADFLIDPSRPGCQTVEATDILLRNRPLITSSHVVIYQVGVIGVTGFHFSELKNGNFRLFVNRLEEDYGPDHHVFNYIGAIHPLDRPTMAKHRISELYDEEVQKTINPASTLYIPPKELLPLAPNAEKVVVTDPTTKIVLQDQISFPGIAPNDALGKVSDPYTENELSAIAALKDHAIPEGYLPYKASPGLQRIVEALSLNSGALRKYLESPLSFAESVDDLDQEEKKILASGSHARIFSAMRGLFGENASLTTALQLQIIIIFLLSQ